MAEAVGDRVHPHVGEHPVGRDPVRDAQGVVEAVAAGPLAERLADAERHVVADDRERGGRHLEQLGQPHPERRRCPLPPVPVELAVGRRVGHPHVETAADRVLMVVHAAAAAGTSCGRRDVGTDRPLPDDRERPFAERADHGEDLVSPTCAITRAWLIWWPRTTSIASSSSTDGGGRTRGTARSPRRTAGPVTCSITSIARAEPAAAEQRAGARR